MLKFVLVPEVLQPDTMKFLHPSKIDAKDSDNSWRPIKSSI